MSARRRPLRLVLIGLSLSSSWGNGHATTFRSLVSGLAARGHEVLFLERDMPWYAAHRDLPRPDFCTLDLVSGTDDLLARHGEAIAGADAVIVGSYVPDGVEVIDRVRALRPRLLCFYDIDTPVTLAALEAGSCDYLAARQVPAFDVYFSFAGGPVLDLLRAQHGARAAVALYCSVDAEAYAPTGEPAAWDLGYLGTYSADRQPALERLLIEPARRLPQARFVVAGPGYPDGIAWPSNVERIEHLPPAGHPSFYSRQRFTLNVTRAAMVAMGWSPSVRLFEAAACGTPVISDPWDGLESILPAGAGLVVARSAADVVAALATPADRRSRLGEAVRRAVARHTGHARAGDLVAALDAAARRRRPAAGAPRHPPSTVREAPA